MSDSEKRLDAARASDGRSSSADSVRAPSSSSVSRLTRLITDRNLLHNLTQSTTMHSTTNGKRLQSLYMTPTTVTSKDFEPKFLSKAL